MNTVGEHRTLTPVEIKQKCIDEAELAAHSSLAGTEKQNLFFAIMLVLYDVPKEELADAYARSVSVASS